MRKWKAKPNGVTFVAVLTACTHAWFIEGRCLYEYRIIVFSPKVEHYGDKVNYWFMMF